MPCLTKHSDRASSGSSDCQNPSGTDCSWYSRCLRIPVSCDVESGGNITAKVEKLCSSSRQSYTRFSSRGKDWVNTMLKCSQERLVPTLQQTPSCRVLRVRSVTTFVSCCMSPSAQAPGLCDLPIEDLRLIKDIVFSSLDLEVLSNLAQEIKVPLSRGCLEKLLQLL
ncbi:uncharacterized protein LOC112560010 [Pomacea canaliculata]|uniref:uncharacterized protein LOC112560010 n=1 Tax=Pomacea canaliculata TaxID=400727 RepID=UPI000D734D6B|nr:uncharacterized protein LOC112560010 [Pomacea canaliculata]